MKINFLEVFNHKICQNCEQLEKPELYSLKTKKGTTQNDYSLSFMFEIKTIFFYYCVLIYVYALQSAGIHEMQMHNLRRL